MLVVIDNKTEEPKRVCGRHNMKWIYKQLRRNKSVLTPDLFLNPPDFDSGHTHYCFCWYGDKTVMASVMWGV